MLSKGQKQGRLMVVQAYQIRHRLSWILVKSTLEPGFQSDMRHLLSSTMSVFTSIHRATAAPRPARFRLFLNCPRSLPTKKLRVLRPEPNACPRMQRAPANVHSGNTGRSRDSKFVRARVMRSTVGDDFTKQNRLSGT